MKVYIKVYIYKDCFHDAFYFRKACYGQDKKLLDHENAKSKVSVCNRWIFVAFCEFLSGEVAININKKYSVVPEVQKEQLGKLEN